MVFSLLLYDDAYNPLLLSVLLAMQFVYSITTSKITATPRLSAGRPRASS